MKFHVILKQKQNMSKHERPCNSHFFENCDLDIWSWTWQMTLTLVLNKGSCPQGIHICKYESSITYHSKVTANVKVFADKQTDKCLPIYRWGGIKISYDRTDFSFWITLHFTAPTFNWMVTSCQVDKRSCLIYIPQLKNFKRHLTLSHMKNY